MNGNRMWFWKGISILLIFLVIAGNMGAVSSKEEEEKKSVKSAAVPEDALTNPELAAAIDAWMSGDIDNCYTLLKAAKEKNTDLSPPEVLMALLFSNAQHYPDMRIWLEKAIALHPNDPEAYFQLAGIAIQDKRLVEADLLLEKGEIGLNALRKDRTDQKKEKGDRDRYLDHEYYTLKGNLARQRGNLSEAELHIQQITKLEPDNDDAFLSLGYLYYEQKKMAEARQSFDQARKLNEKRFFGWLLLALLLDRDNQSEEAKKLVDDNFKEGMFGTPTSVPVVRLYMKWDRMEDADKMIEDLQKKFPNAVDPWILAGEMALHRHQYRPAEDRFRRAVLAEQDNFDANNGLALALGDQRNRAKLKEAREIAYRNWQKYPQSQEARITYAWMLYLSGEHKEAEAFFAPMLESGKISPTIAYYLAEIAHTKGENSLALNFIDLALEQKNNFPKREAALELQKIIEDKLEKEKENSK